MKRLTLVFAVATSACNRVGPGVTMRVAPPDVPFCTAEQVQGLFDGPDIPGLVDPSIPSACTRVLRRRYPELTIDTWDGSIHFRLEADATGRVSDVCVIDGTFGDVPEYVSCIAEEVRAHARFAPNFRVRWTLAFVMD